MYANTHQRRRYQRVLVGENNKLVYRGENFGGRKSHRGQLSKVLVGVHDKEAGALRLVEAGQLPLAYSQAGWRRVALSAGVAHRTAVPARRGARERLGHCCACQGLEPCPLRRGPGQSAFPEAASA